MFKLEVRSNFSSLLSLVDRNDVFFLVTGTGRNLGSPLNGAVAGDGANGIPAFSSNTSESLPHISFVGKDA